MTRFFWLLSDGKTVKEVPREFVVKRLMSPRYHWVNLHGNGDFYTSRPYISHVQMRQLVKFMTFSDYAQLSAQHKVMER